MLLRAVELNYVGRFRNFRTALAGRQIGVVGKNGAGKSTLMSGLHYAITGDLGRLGGKTDAVNVTRPKDSDSPFVRLDFYPEDTTDGDPAVVLRKLPADGRDGGRKLTYGDRVWTAQADLADRFERWTGLSAKAMSEFVFVQQGGLDQLVRAAPAKRAEVLQRVFGVAHADRVCDAAREKLSQLPLGVDSGVLSTLRAAAVDAIAAAETAEAAHRNHTAPNPSIETHARGVIRAAYEADAAATARAAAVSALARVEALAPVIPTTPRTSQATIAELQRNVTDAHRYANQVKSYEDEEQRFQAQIRLVPPDVAAPTNPPAVSDELRDLRSRQYVLTVVANAPNDCPGTCPVCDGQMSHGVSDRNTARAQLDRLAALEADFQLGCRAYDKAVELFHLAARRREEAMTLAKAAFLRAEKAKAAIGPKPDATLTDLTERLNVARRAEGEWAAYDRAVVEFQRRRAEAEAALATCPVLPPVPRADVEAAERTLMALDLDRTAREVLRVRAETLREAAAAAEETVRQAESKSTLALSSAGWRARLDKIRQIFHRDAAPAEAVRSCLLGLSADLNRRLGHLAARFRVNMGPDGELRATYADGTSTRSVPADRVSGGEGCVLGLAWRLALLDRYAPRAGLLCLDEPTTGLDGERVAALRSALEAWRPHGTGRQFVIVTHERKLLSVFDTVVDLDTG